MIYLISPDIDTTRSYQIYTLTLYIRGGPGDFPGGGGLNKSPLPPLTNFLQNLSINFLIQPSKVIPFNTKNKGYQEPSPHLNQLGGSVRPHLAFECISYKRRIWSGPPKMALNENWTYLFKIVLKSFQSSNRIYLFYKTTGIIYYEYRSYLYIDILRNIYF